MKRLVLIGVGLALLLGLILVPAVAAVSADIIIHKTIGPNCPEETFRFEAWRDMNGNGVLDAVDTLQGWVDITGADTGIITVGTLGHELGPNGAQVEPLPTLRSMAGKKEENSLSPFGKDLPRIQ